MWFKVAVLIVVSLAMFCTVHTNNGQDDVQAKKRAINRANPPTTLADMFKLLVELEQRVMAVESRRENLLRGRDGRDGMPGKPGKDGHDGKDGRDGKDGLPGPRGPSGLKGDPGMKGVRGRPGPKSGGVQYVRWGRTTCPYNTTLVFKGRVGGEYYGHKGGGGNYVCLPETPKYGRYKDGNQEAGFMYGTEYQVSTYNPFIKRNLHDHEVPCAACYVKTRNAKMMIPATFECPVGWSREYHGYLMSEYHNHPHSTQFICVDENAEGVPGTQANLNGALLYPVEGRCGSLPCHPYVDGRELTCVVCTK